MSSLMVAIPELDTASSALAELGSAIRAANAAAAGSTTQVLAAAEAEVSAAISELFGTYAQTPRPWSAPAPPPAAAPPAGRR